MEFVVFIFICVCAWGIFKIINSNISSNNKEVESNKSHQNYSSNRPRPKGKRVYKIAPKPIDELPYPNEDTIDYSISGINYRGLKMEDVGQFEGYAHAETNNKYDEYAVAIYQDNGLHVGFLPSGDEETHDYIMSLGGYIKVTGEIKHSDNEGGYFYGEVEMPMPPEDDE